MQMNPRSVPKGFSLIEIMIAITLTGVTALALSSLARNAKINELKGANQLAIISAKTLLVRALDPEDRCKANLTISTATPANLSQPVTVLSGPSVVLFQDGTAKDQILYSLKLKAPPAATPVTRADGTQERVYYAILQVDGSPTKQILGKAPGSFSFSLPVALRFNLANQYLGCTLRRGGDAAEAPPAGAHSKSDCLLAGGIPQVIADQIYCQFPYVEGNSAHYCPPGYTQIAAGPINITCQMPTDSITPDCNDPTNNWSGGWVSNNPPYTYYCKNSYLWPDSTGNILPCPTGNNLTMTPVLPNICSPRGDCTATNAPSCCFESCPTGSWVYDPMTDGWNFVCPVWQCDDNRIYNCTSTCTILLASTCPNSPAPTNPWYALPPASGGKCVMAPKVCPNTWNVDTVQTIAGVLLPSAYSLPTSTIVRPKTCKKLYNPSTLATCPTSWQTLGQSQAGATCF